MALILSESGCAHHRYADRVSQTTARNDTCVFCEIVAGRIPSDKVAEDANTLAFMDIDPGADGHLQEQGPHGAAFRAGHPL
jgi:hypothetical protein